MILATGLTLWVALLYSAIAQRLSGHESSKLSWLFIAAAVTIPVFYVPAFFYNTATNFTIVDLWRFWIIHLWVEHFLELFVACAVAIIFYQLAIVSSTTAARVVYLDALLYARRRDHRHRASLVLHRPGTDCDGAELSFLGDGGRPTDSFIFILLGVVPLVIAALKTYTNLDAGPALSINAEPEPARAAS